MKKNVLGIHHITAISSDAQKNVDFYSGILGMRLVKKTINFDDPYTYHLYFGDERGNPGTILTFFPWGKKAFKGKRGTGQVTTISYSVDKSALEYWQKRLENFAINFSDPFERFDDEVIIFEDNDGFEIELVFTSADKREGWENGSIPKEYSIRGFYSATITEESLSETSKILKEIGFNEVRSEDQRHRFESGSGGPGTFVDVQILPNSLSGRMGVGAIHHIAYRAEDDEAQSFQQQNLMEKGYNVTPVMDRNYFHSIYFREPGGVLFEIATDPPGFLIDEEINNLGKTLKLPPWYEEKRKDIESKLPIISVSKNI